MYSESAHSQTSQPLEMFGIHLDHTRLEPNEYPPDISARESLLELSLAGDEEALAALQNDLNQVGQIVKVTKETPQGTLDLTDIFTANQIHDMAILLQEYLGMDLGSYLESTPMPIGYPNYVGRLATYFSASNDDITRQFGQFESRHTNPLPHATGPLETNSREYANSAIEILLYQIHDFYQADFTVSLTGPQKKVPGTRISWERGIAECQFLVLDYIRDQLIGGPNVTSDVRETMSLEDISSNLTTLLKNRSKLVSKVSLINPLLAQELDQTLISMASLTTETLHRGRLGVLGYEKSPDKARKIISKAESLLVQAASQAQIRSDQQDVPVLDI